VFVCVGVCLWPPDTDLHPPHNTQHASHSKFNKSLIKSAFVGECTVYIRHCFGKMMENIPNKTIYANKENGSVL
jgi:hypothetical protein